MRILLLLSVFSLVACSGRTNRPNKYPKPSPNPMERNRLGELIDEAWPPSPATPGKPLLRVVDPTPPTRSTRFGRLPNHPGNQHYEVVRRYELTNVPGRRLTVSPDGKGIAIATGVADQVIVLSDVDDPSTERVLHLGKPKNTHSRWRGYAAYAVAWCGGDTPTLYIAAHTAMWAVNPQTLKTLPGWPIARTERETIWGVLCLVDGAVATTQSMLPPKGFITVFHPDGSVHNPPPKGSITIFGRDGTKRISRQFYEYLPHTLALTNTGLILTEFIDGILLINPDTGGIMHKATTVSIERLSSSKRQGRFAASPTKPNIAIDTTINSGIQPVQASIPELQFRVFPELDELSTLDKTNSNDDSIPWMSRAHERAIKRIDMMNYSRDGRDLLIAGSESTHPGRGRPNVIWVLRDGKLYDTLVGHMGTGTDIGSLSDGRIVSLAGGIDGGMAEIFIWAPKKTPEATSQPVSPQAAD